MGPVIQANGTFEDDLRSGGLLCFISIKASIHTELADSMVTGGTQERLGFVREGIWAVGYIQQLKGLLENSSVILHDKNSPKNRTEILTKTDIVQCSYISVIINTPLVLWPF